MFYLFLIVLALLSTPVHAATVSSSGGGSSSQASSIANSTSLPGTCAVGDIYMDTNATSGQRLYLCESTNTWALQGDGGAGTGMTHPQTMARASIGF
jgi:hypothetical protein